MKVLFVFYLFIFPCLVLGNALDLIKNLFRNEISSKNEKIIKAGEGKVKEYNYNYLTI
jgi:hypothetical protein